MSLCGCTAGHVTRRIVLTGGPGAGKTAALEVLRRTFCAHLVRWGSRTTPLGHTDAALPPCTSTALEMVRAIRARKALTGAQSAPGLNDARVAEAR